MAVDVGRWWAAQRAQATDFGLIQMLSTFDPNAYDRMIAGMDRTGYRNYVRFCVWRPPPDEDE